MCSDENCTRPRVADPLAYLAADRGCVDIPVPDLD